MDEGAEYLKMSSTESTVTAVHNHPRRRKRSKSKPPDMRIVLLGKCASENSAVGNFILGRASFDSEAPPDVVERVGGSWKNRHMTIINSPQLLQPHLSIRQITQTVIECVYLSDPGPHVIVLLLKHDQCSTEDQECVEKVLDSFSERVYRHAMVISTQEPTETNDILKKIIQKCFNRHFSLQRSSSPDGLLQVFEDIVQMNDGHYLVCTKNEALQYFTMKQQAIETFSQGMKLNLVVCGSDGTLKSSISERILQQTDRRSDVELHGCQINMVELPALFNTRISQEEVMHQILRCVSLCHPGVHVFLLIIPDAPLTDEVKAEMEEIQRIFSSRIKKHIMFVIMQNSGHQTAELNKETQAVIESFGGRHNFFSPKTQVSTLMENIKQMVEENRQEFFSTETFLEAQMKTLMKFEEMKKKMYSLEAHFLSKGSTESEDDLRIVLLGKTGVGKSATGNTILGKVAFTAETSQESITKESKKETSEINDRHVTVIDTPGLFDTELTNEEIQREITNCISMILPGPHVFIIVLSLGQRFSQEESKSVKIIQETFGENSSMYTMVLFTRGDDLRNKTIQQCLGKPGSPLWNLIEACGNRYHVFNNNQTEDRTQVFDLLEKIDAMVKANGGSFYSCKMFRQMEREKQEQQIKFLMETVEQMNREREEMMKKHEEEMKIEQKTFTNEIEQIKQEIDKINTEKEELQIKYDTEIDRLMNRIQYEINKREVEYIEKKLYKAQIEEKEKETRKEMRREREQWERQKQQEKIRGEEEDKKRRKKEQILDEFNQRLKKEREKLELEKEDLRSKHEAQENNMKMLMEQLNREREELMKKQEEEKRRIKVIEEEKQNQEKERKRSKEEDKMRWEREKLISEEHIQRLKSEMVEVLRGKERIERERKEQLKDLEKRLKEERNKREDQQQIFEEKMKPFEKENENELKVRRVEWREIYERKKEEIKICSETDDPLQVTAFRRLETEYSKWSWSLRNGMMKTENKLHNKIYNEAVHEVEETDLHRELDTTSEEVEKSMSEFFEKDSEAEILVQWKSSIDIKIKTLQENIVRETKRKLNEIFQQRDLKKKIDAQRTHHENTLYEKSKELALKLKVKANDEEMLKKEFDLFWEQRVQKIITDNYVVKDIDIMKDAKLLLSDVYKSALLNYWKESRNILSLPSYSDYVRLNRFSGFTSPIENAIRSAKELFGYVLSPEDEAQIRSLVTDVVQQTDTMIQSFNISKMGYNKSCIQQLTNYIKTRVKEHEEGPVKYVFKKQFFMDLVYSICNRANNKITDQYRLFREANDPVIYVEKKREEYYSIFQKYCHGATSAAIYGEIICQKFKEPIEQSVYKKTARDLANEIRTICESLNGNRSNLEKHILRKLAEEEDFNKYMNYVKTPRDHFKSFIRDEVSRYITDKFSVSVLPKMKKNIKLLQQKIMKAAHESTEHVQVNSGDAGLWLKSFTQQLSDELIFSEKDLSGVKHDDVYDFNLLEDVIRQELPAIMSDIISKFNTETCSVSLDCKFWPDEILIDHFCQCCWVQCPFCGAICASTIDNCHRDHSVAFHRVTGINGTCFDSTQNLSAYICTNFVEYDLNFNTPNGRFIWKEIKIAGPRFDIWSIIPDFSELPYWKWFVCSFQKDLEKYYNKIFEGLGKIPDEWRKYSKQDAIESLDQYL